MNKSVVAITISLVAGLAAAAIVYTARGPEPAAVTDIGPGEYFDQSAATEDRIRALEAAVAEERNARQLLEDEIQILYAEIEQLSDGQDERLAADEEIAVESRENRERMEVFRQQRADRAIEERLAQLINSGFTPERAQWIVQRESELQMEVMQARFDARRSGQPMDPFNPTLNPNSALRAELGDSQYEQYLQATNRPTTISIGSVLESSPGQRAGLQPGDEIVNYDGSRVFDVFDLNQQTMQGEPGESVVIDIRRDGMPMQVVLPRGPIGVSTGRFRGR